MLFCNQLLATDLDGLAVRRGARHGGLDAAAVVYLLAADHDGRVPDAIELHAMQAYPYERSHA